LFFIPNQFLHHSFFSKLIAGKLTRLLVGTRSNGTRNFIIASIDGSLRYPQDYSYYIQNFTVLRSEKVLEPDLESTF
jgi:translocon-associated protein subunit alpha